MLLLIDAGNTFIKWVLVSADSPILPGSEQWHSFGASPHHELENLSSRWQQLERIRPISHVLISNVAGEKIRKNLLHHLNKVQPKPISIEWFSSAAELAGIRNNYSDYRQLGSDRFAAMIGARTLFPKQTLIVATCGTATTIDMVSADGVFIGGMILPGLRLMTASLAKNTAQLPEIERLNEDQPFFATDTSSAIRSGCITAQVGAIEHAFSLHKNHFDKVQCILSGGAASHIAPYLSIPCTLIDNLVLIGLQAVITNKGTLDPLC